MMIVIGSKPRYPAKSFPPKLKLEALLVTSSTIAVRKTRFKQTFKLCAPFIHFVLQLLLFHLKIYQKWNFG